MDGDVTVIERTFGEDHHTLSPDGKTLTFCDIEALRFINISSNRTADKSSKAVDTASVAHWHPSGQPFKKLDGQDERIRRATPSRVATEFAITT